MTPFVPFYNPSFLCFLWFYEALGLTFPYATEVGITDNSVCACMLACVRQLFNSGRVC